jgi:hypothetical protein
LATWAQRSEDTNFVTVHVQEVVVNGEQAYEGQEERGGREEMPHVVVVKEIHPVARFVQVSKTKRKNEKIVICTVRTSLHFQIPELDRGLESLPLKGLSREIDIKNFD